MKMKYAARGKTDKSENKISNGVKIILASGSPRRREILKAAGFKFSVIIPDVSERISGSVMPSTAVKMLALKKARYAEKKMSVCGSAKKRLFIVGADTIVVLNGKIIGKPRNTAHAKRILQSLSGSKHYVYTGVAVVDLFNKKTLVDYERTVVIFKKLFDEDIEKAMHSHLDKAGAYSIQEENDMFVKKIAGDYLNVVGFPLGKFKKMLKKIGADKLF